MIEEEMRIRPVLGAGRGKSKKKKPKNGIKSGLPALLFSSVTNQSGGSLTGPKGKRLKFQPGEAAGPVVEGKGNKPVRSRRRCKGGTGGPRGKVQKKDYCSSFNLAIQPKRKSWGKVFED